MNKNFTLNRLESSKENPAHKQFKIFKHSADICFFAIILLALLFLSYIVEAQNYPASFSQVQVSSGISSPTNFEFAPDGRIFIAQQNGQLRIIKNGTLLAKPFISLSVNSNGERGLLGIAFDPSFNTNHFIYLYYTLSSGANNRVSRFTASGDTAMPGSEVVVLNLDPLSSATNHNGGSIHFGPDGKLFIAAGENANGAHAQDLNSYLGKLLRINSDGSVPSGNPFTTGSAQQMRIWSYGLRNPFTFSFQPGTGKIFIDDVGEITWEEINDATASGLNYGWPNAEGHSTNTSYTNPVYYYGHGSGATLGCALTGGTFFNPSSTNYPSTYIGKYFFLDYCGNWIDMLTYNGSTWSRSGFATSISGHPVAMNVGPDGNLYFLSRDQSAIYKIVYTATNTMAPVADAYVRSGVNANTNYGSATVLQAKQAGTTSDNDQRMYLRFNISAIANSVSNAKLRLYGNMNGASPPSVNMDVRNVTNQSWQENTINYSNKPGAQTTIYGTKTISGTIPQYYEWDITNLVQLRKNAGAGVISLMLRCNSSLTNGNFAKFNSKEASANKPQLVVTSSNAFAPSENENLKTATEFSEYDISENDLTIFPNPASDQVTIELNTEKAKSILKIVDISGRVCLNEMINPGNNIISTKYLSNGIYTLIVESKEGILRKKLQIIK